VTLVPERPAVFVLDPIAESALAALRRAAHVVEAAEAQARWVEEADAVIVRTCDVRADAIARAKRLRVIGKHGVGTDNIDRAAAERRGVAVVTTPGTNADAVAELALGMALALLRDICRHDDALRSGRVLAGHARVGLDLGGLPVGILGLGAVGGAVARRLDLGFGAEVAAYDPGIPPERWPAGVARMGDLMSLLERSRMLFVHVPLQPDTRHMIGRAELQAMPPDSFLVNCARGGVVDEAALAEALRTRHLAGAASDVFETEPPAPNHPLFACDRFIATPHIGGSTEGSLARTGAAVVAGVLDALGVECRTS
jgi:D-3-phosphoglycerate dehydrogenase